jgi:type IV pilus assembly protein PilE
MSLIELMIVVAIIGILSAIAYPSYRGYVLRGGRTEAKALMADFAQRLEKCYTRFGAYNNAGCTAFSDATAGRMTETGKYRVSFQAQAADSYTLQAVPQQGQVADSRCQTLSLNETGLRSISVSGATQVQIQECWR